jgi:uncharacterized DUF497 family protein
MEISFDPAKRDATLANRGLDFSRAAELFAEQTATVADRRNYGEPRFLTAGLMDGRLVIVVWTPRGAGRRIISMRHCHADEEKDWLDRMD